MAGKMMAEDRRISTGENKLGKMPIGKLLAVMSLPTTFSMLIQALYNIVDSIFVSHFSEKALTAVSLAFPLQMLMFSFSIGTSIGTCSVISRRLGEGREDAADRTAQSGFSSRPLRSFCSARMWTS